jgi:predicted ATPase/DNA-binding winged helix-turn-helix (wHTH) protein
LGESAISFGPYRLIAAQRLLLEDGKPVRLGSRAFDILTALVERPGEVVSKDELIARAWPETNVDEANLKIQVSALRRALGDGQGTNRYVVNVVGRGYNFVAPTRQELPPRAPPPPANAPLAPHNLPFLTTRMIGREETLTRLVTQLSDQRLMTIVGPGGIGKTTIALAVAERMIGAYEHGVWLVDLAPLRDHGLVPSAVATVLGVEVRAEDPRLGLVAALRGRRMLLLLDNCEHVVDAAAGLTAALLSGTPGVSVLATSRERLGVPGERVYRLGVLGSPEPSPALTAAEAAAFPAVQLFVERVSAIVEDFTLTDANAAPVVTICRRLDGLPLAIEFAAPRVEALGIEGLAALLDDSFRRLPGARRRAVMPRHRTMQAVIDWSYGLVNADEQRFFRALGIFAGGFTSEAAAAVAMDAAEARADAIGRLADLIMKSLVAADVSAAKPRFRLLDTTRAFALEKLQVSGEREAAARRHAEYYRTLFEQAEGEAAKRTADEWPRDYAREIDNLRAALDWAFSPRGDSTLGVALTIAAIPLWIKMSLVRECRWRGEQAIAVLDQNSDVGHRSELRLLIALATTMQNGSGPGEENTRLWTRANALAERLGDNDFRLRTLWGLWIDCRNRGEHREALQVANRFQALASSNGAPDDMLVADRMVGMSLFILGNLRDARGHAERMLAHYDESSRTALMVRFHFEQRAGAVGLFALILWLQGFHERARSMIDEGVVEASNNGNALHICVHLMQFSCPVAFLAGDLGRLDCFVSRLLDSARRQGLAAWTARGRCWQALLRIRGGAVVAGVAELETALREFPGSGRAYQHAWLLGELAMAQVDAVQSVEAHASIERALERSRTGGELWCVPELLRIRGHVLLSRARLAEAESAFREALAFARRQEALSWELRIATSLAGLLRDQDRAADAIACLQPIYERFTEGFGSVDLIAAKQLLDNLGCAGRGKGFAQP